jgi:hypothetical protein
VNTHGASFALRVVRRQAGDSAIVYRRSLGADDRERLRRLAAIGPLAFSAGAPLLRAAVRAAEGPAAGLSVGKFHPLNPEWGARVACYARVSAGLRNPGGLQRAATQLQQADGVEAAWWLGLLTNGRGPRAVRALRILLEAVD